MELETRLAATAMDTSLTALDIWETDLVWGSGTHFKLNIAIKVDKTSGILLKHLKIIQTNKQKMVKRIYDYHTFQRNKMKAFPLNLERKSPGQW